MNIEATRSNTRQFSILSTTGGATDDYEHILAHKFVGLVKWGGLRDMVESVVAVLNHQSLERELILTSSANGIKRYETRGIPHALGLVERSPPSLPVWEQPGRIGGAASGKKPTRTTILNCST